MTRTERLLRLARIRGDLLAIAVLESRTQPKRFVDLADYVLWTPEHRRRAA